MFKIPNHSNLNSKLWDSDKSLRPEVADVLSRVYISFMTVLSNYFGLPLDIENDIVDIIFCGSLVGYFYDKNSDINIIIIIKPDRYLKKMRPEIFDRLAKFIINFFLTKYNPKIYGINFDISLVSSDDYEFARYSLIQNKWLREPTKLTDKEVKEIEKESKKIYLEIRKYINGLLKDKNKHGEIIKVIYELKKRRDDLWNGDVGEYLKFARAYSKISHSGLIRKIREADTNLIKKLMMGK
jgi:hypothetical protein